YSEDPDAIEHLKILIKKQYLSKYPELQLIVDTEITTKKEFDKLVMNTMSDCYKIEFITVKKEKILEEVEK
ncbi:MAG: hypothetical protein LBD11_05750, partial [Candidatus Peribacteria bacterium]|nr:hypothetical protein [Candidatus Peribacteria bacterium]